MDFQSEKISELSKTSRFSCVFSISSKQKVPTCWLKTDFLSGLWCEKIVLCIVCPEEAISMSHWSFEQVFQ